MKILNIILLIFVFTLGFSCNEKRDQTKETNSKINDAINLLKFTKEINNNIIENQLSNVEINSIIKEIKNQLVKKELENHSFSEMSFCGGSLEGFYRDKTLKYINSKYNAELGFSSKQIFWNKGKILKIIYQEHFAEWEKYEKKYPSNKFKYNPNKMTYTDTIYEITFGKKYQYKKLSKNKIISKDINQELIIRLTNCANEMYNELETEIE